MTKPLLSALVALTVALPAALASASPASDLPGCGEEKKPQDEPKAPKPSADPLCGEDKKPESPKEPKS
jgi:hypothetical protein